eukprot:gnl/Chilomastix_caulleri/2235.p1 GENE.gnl/Chilomastix_caulleri/2235~~gnl/Chilomastix_caulleri/2235.p1  ORF type:complete len:135 (+),score=45.96 gnl/Chilomastix_caulleri/2235:567-971(+)
MPINTYTLRRMGKVFGVNYTCDGRFILSGSDDGNIRIWKSDPDAAIHAQPKREVEAQQYRRALVDKYQTLPEVAKILRQQPKPAALRNKGRIMHEKTESIKRSAQRSKASGSTLSANAQHIERGARANQIAKRR